MYTRWGARGEKYKKAKYKMSPKQEKLKEEMFRLIFKIKSSDDAKSIRIPVIDVNENEIGSVLVLDFCSQWYKAWNGCLNYDRTSFLLGSACNLDRWWNHEDFPWCLTINQILLLGQLSNTPHFTFYQSYYSPANC